MPIASISILRHRAAVHTGSLPALTSVLRRLGAVRCLSITAAKQPQNPDSVSKKLQQPSKKLLRAKQTLKDYYSLSPELSLDDNPLLSEDQAVGTVAAAQANFMRVIVQPRPAEEPSGNFDAESAGDSSRIGVELLCVVRAVLKKIRRRVLVGDKVVVGAIDWVDRRGVIENVFQRKSEILDPPVANVDHLLVLFSMDQPKPEPFTLTRFLVEAESTGIPLTLALNKSELVDEEAMISWKTRLSSWGYEPILCSVESKHGLDTLAFILRDQTTVIVGPSGVGKSSLINALRNDQLAPRDAEDNWFDSILGSKCFEEQRVGEVSRRSGRGKHTTRNVALLPLSGGGCLADTPGFNQPSLLKVTKQSLAQAFPEIQKILNASEPAKCSFNDCLHLGEPGCIVKGGWERYPYYFQLLDEIRIREEFQLRTFGTKKEGNVRYKVGDGGVQQAEPRLEIKKHRRQSRKRLNQSILDELSDLDDEDDSDKIAGYIGNEDR
ncbi:Putative ribosome biogenesis GTPase RsgA [Morus notabilis]|uniref:Putative ribosome biogenesis GTPase RsgA n=1 Tax=Morus notabilis TaxID=981085 RepID=W9SGY1_9ROSA|nr:small ribosomal subunit biogenesis GTPase RsgA 1, mitochondrial [Morus notabilis]EXC06148.1 Putative ribosome biogenesis GTPase RsgA [Morus notabilis]